MGNNYKTKFGTQKDLIVLKNFKGIKRSCRSRDVSRDCSSKKIEHTFDEVPMGFRVGIEIKILNLKTLF